MDELNLTESAPTKAHLGVWICPKGHKETMPLEANGVCRRCNYRRPMKLMTVKDGKLIKPRFTEDEKR